MMSFGMAQDIEKEKRERMMHNMGKQDHSQPLPRPKKDD